MGKHDDTRSRTLIQLFEFYQNIIESYIKAYEQYTLQGIINETYVGYSSNAS